MCPAGRRYRSTANRSTAFSSKCEQCHVVSWRRKLNTDWFASFLCFSSNCLHHAAQPRPSAACTENEKTAASEHNKTSSSATLAPPGDGPMHRQRRQSLRPAGRTTQLRTAASSPGVPANIQLLSIPQLDAGGH